MANIFISYCSKDKKIIGDILNNLEALPEYHNLWHYQHSNMKGLSMEEIIDKLYDVDLFIIFISHNSLNSPHVQRELQEAIDLFKNGRIREIFPIILDNSLNLGSDARIPNFIRNLNIQYAKSPIHAADIIKEALQNH